MHIRPVTPADAAAIAELMTELNQSEGHAVVATAAEMANALFLPDRDVKLSALVALEAGKLVGVVLYYPGYDTLSASTGFHLADISVTKKYQRQGIGRALVKQLAANVLAEGKEWLSLTVAPRNEAAQKFYMSLGMVKVDADFLAIGKQALAKIQ